MKKLSLAAFFLFLCVGLCSQLPHLMFEQNQDRMPGDLGDARFNHLLLEYNYRALARVPWSDYWSPTWAFYPVKNALAFSDNLILATPPYALFRLLGFGQNQSFLYWFVLCAVLNYGAAFILLRFLKYEVFSASVGAYIFAFALPTIALLQHAQLCLRFFMPLSLMVYVFALATDRREKRALFAVAGTVLVAAQVWAGIYSGWFLVLFYLLAGFWLCLAKRRRIVTVNYVKEHWPLLLCMAVLFVVLVLPVLLPYLSAKGVMGGRKWYDVRHSLPTLAGYLIAPRSSLFYGFMTYDTWAWLSVLPKHDTAPLFLGSATMLSAAYVCVKRANMSGTARFAVGMLAILVLVSCCIYRSVTIWQIVYGLIPGADAIRGVSRLVLLMLLPLAILIATAVHQLIVSPKKLCRFFGLLMGLVIVAEHMSLGPVTYSFAEHDARVAHITQQLQGRDCGVFFYRGSSRLDYDVQLDAMWASLESAVPTMNGYSGNYPKGWDFYTPSAVLDDQLTAVLATEGLASNPCVVF